MLDFVSAVRTLERLDPRIPRWPTPLVPRCCPLCGGPGTHLARRPDGLEANRCQACLSAFISPAPSAQALADFYASFNAKHRHTPLTDRHARELRRATVSGDHRLVELSSELDLAHASVLDVGCGDGATLARLRSAGARVTGLDLDRDAVAFVRERLSIDARLGDLLTCDLADRGPFHLITMLDFIEHPLNPLDYIERAASLLVRDGILAMWTPNGSEISSATDFTALRVDLEHMTYFSLRSCSLIARQYGLDLIHLEGIGYPHLDQFIGPVAASAGSTAAMRVSAFANRKLRGIKRRTSVATRVLLRGSDTVTLNSLPVSPAEKRERAYHLFALFRKTSPTVPSKVS